MTAPFQRAVRRIPTPIAIAERRTNRRHDRNYRPVPISQIPLEQRTGMLHIFIAPGGVEVDGPEQDKVYPHGAFYRYSGGSYGVCLDVMPRGLREGEYARLLEQARVQRLATQRTPIVVSREPGVTYGRSSTGTDAHLTLVQPAQVLRYLGGVLPFIGVDPRDVPLVVQHVEALLERGKHRLAER